MKKLLALVLVLGMASMASAGVVDVLGNGVAGDVMAPVGSFVQLKIALNYNAVFPAYGAYASYDGYCLSSADFALAVSGPGTLFVGMNTKGTLTDLKRSASASAWGQAFEVGAAIDGPSLGGKIAPVAGNSIAQLSGVWPDPGLLGPADIVWNFMVRVDGEGQINVNLILNGQSDYRASQLDGQANPVGWSILNEQQLGDLAINVPEPMTMGLLAIGGMALLRRRRA